jgi:Holliday junction DNA helicase RuvA
MMPGVGPKLAARIVNELGDKAPGIMALGAQGKRAAAASGPVAAALAPATGPMALPEDAALTADALSALVNLGYDRMQAARAVAEAAEAGADGSAGLIKAALKTLGRNL